MCLCVVVLLVWGVFWVLGCVVCVVLFFFSYLLRWLCFVLFVESCVWCVVCCVLCVVCCVLCVVCCVLCVACRVLRVASGV